MLGAKTIIRLGTCGSMQPYIKTGDLIVATGACREDGYTNYVAPKPFPAVCDNQLALDLYNQAKAMGTTVYMGVALTSGMFYPVNSMPSTLKVNADTGALFVEMELAALFVIGSLRGIRTAGIAVDDGNVFVENAYDPHGNTVSDGKVKMIKAGLIVAKKAAIEDNQKEKVHFFNEQKDAEYLQIFKSKNLFDFLETIESLDYSKRNLLL